MRGLLAAAVMLLLASCDYLFSAEPIPNPEPEFLPVVLGSQISYDEEFFAEVLIAADGSVQFRGETITHEELLRKLRVYAERRRDMEEPDQPSEVCLLIVADRRADWAATRRVLWAGFDGDVRMYKAVFRTLHERSGRAGMTAAWLPRWKMVTEWKPVKPPKPSGEFTRVEIRGTGPVDREAVYAATRGLPERPVVIRAGDDVPTGEVLRAYDVLLRAGREFILLSHGPPPDESPDALRVDGRPPPGRAAIPDPPDRGDGHWPEGALPPRKEDPR